MLKKCTVVMLPTNEKAILWKSKSSKNCPNGTLTKWGKDNPDNICGNNQHLYILSDDEVKEGDWIMRDFDNVIIKDNINSDNRKGNGKFYKIIASTDKNLNLPCPSESFIIKYIESYNTGKPIVDVLVEYEYFEDTSKEYTDKGQPVILYPRVSQKDNTITIKKVKDSWSREELDIILNDVMNLGMIVRQDQLSGFIIDKSGNEILEEWKLANL